MGGHGYSNCLLIATAKSSVPNAFSGASSYAPYIVELLLEHQSAGPFYSKMTESLYSTPMKENSTVNFATDTKRELDHIDAV